MTHLLILNAWVPLLFVYGQATAQERYREQAVSLMQQLPPEDNAVIRRFHATGVHPVNAAQSQALLQIYNNYCQSRRCLECRIGHSIIKQTSTPVNSHNPHQ